MATDLAISVKDEPGGLADVGEALGNAGINIIGLFGVGLDGRGVIHLCVDDAAAARAALEGAGITVDGEADAILGPPVQNAEEPGTLGVIARSIANAGVNVRVAYIATGSRPVVVTDDNAKVLELMKNMM
ncbi:MAG TPA: ACT domain-containing protein [Actinomycetota bacterium]|nr:ACT domain-containing protein [Actinomycetota bacterium]